MTFEPKSFLTTLPAKPGVYCMLDSAGKVLYVGKARHLKKRVASYFTRSHTISPKTQSLVAQISHIEITVTHTENEALILENTLIKQHQPRYNILLRDDKSYPYIFLSAHTFPRLGLHRGAKRAKGHYFGPYPHAHAVYESLNLLQKLFPIRQCEDSFFRHRSRPCLQYQIKRCTAPCVGLIDVDSYREEVQRTILFLEGKSQAVITNLVEKMQTAAQALEFEKAADYRNQISKLNTLQEQQCINTEAGNIDIIAGLVQAGVGCVQVLTVRDGRHIGNRAYFPHHTQEADESALLTAFLPQYYLAQHRDIPDEVIVNQELEDFSLLATVISQQRGKPVQIHSKVRGIKTKWVEMAMENAQISLAQRQPSQYREQLAALTIALGLPALPQRLECFDVSHTQGEATVASCVVFTAEGVCPSAYRRFNIEQITAGDDYAALRQALTRHYRKVHKSQYPLPDVLLIDGGVGQVKVAYEVLTGLQLQEVCIVGVAKGAGRKPGLETLILPNEEKPLLLPRHSPALLLIQQIRDAAHRFAITSHRQKREKTRRTSQLEQIVGIGTKRRQRLLSHFGGLQGIMRAGVDDLARVPGISKELAQKIYDFFITT